MEFQARHNLRPRKMRVAARPATLHSHREVSHAVPAAGKGCAVTRAIYESLEPESVGSRGYGREMGVFRELERDCGGAGLRV